MYSHGTLTCLTWKMARYASWPEALSAVALCYYELLIDCTKAWQTGRNVISSHNQGPGSGSKHVVGTVFVILVLVLTLCCKRAFFTVCILISAKTQYLLRCFITWVLVLASLLHGQTATNVLLSCLDALKEICSKISNLQPWSCSWWSMTSLKTDWQIRRTWHNLMAFDT